MTSRVAKRYGPEACKKAERIYTAVLGCSGSRTFSLQALDVLVHRLCVVNHFKTWRNVVSAHIWETTA